MTAPIEPVSLDDLPTPPELSAGGDADPDRAHRHREPEDLDDDDPGPEPEDAPFDTEASFAAYVAYCERSRMLACLYPFRAAPKR